MTAAIANKQFAPSKDWASAAQGQFNLFQRSARNTVQGCALNLTVFQLQKVSETDSNIQYSLSYDITSDEGSCYTVLSFKVLLNMSPGSSVELCGSEPLNTRRGVHDLTFDIPIEDLSSGDYTLQVQFSGRGVPIITRNITFTLNQ